jgi:hypothetical protein
MFAALAEGYGDLKDKINLFVALCPITNLGYTTNKGMVKYSNPSSYNKIVKVLADMSINEFYGPEWKYASGALCLEFPC